MEYKISSIISSGNGIWNEDRLLISEKIIGVIDGATPIHKMKYMEYHTLAEWMVDNFEKKFNDIVIKGENSYKQICRQFIHEMGEDRFIKSLEDYDKPCFTSATVTILDDKIKCEIIGDSFIYIQNKSGKLIQLTDKRVDKYSGRTVEVTNKARCNDLDIETAVEKQKMKNRKMMNVKGGYWVVAFNGYFEDEFIEEYFPINDINRILICTDGFERLQQEFSLISFEQILNDEISLDTATDLLRDYENNNYLKDDYPCVKKSDDSAAILLYFN